MSVTKDLRRFLIADNAITIKKIEEGKSHVEADEDGFIVIAIQDTERARLLTKSDGSPETVIFDVEIYHEDPDTVESCVNAIHALDMHNGDFGNGHVQAIFVDNQSNEYVPRVQFEEEPSFDFAFVRLEVRGYS